jgi:hypothetical protein
MPVVADPPKSIGTPSGGRWLIASSTRLRLGPILFSGFIAAAPVSRLAGVGPRVS